MAEREIVLAPDTERIQRGDATATADAIEFLSLRVTQLEEELTRTKVQGLGANIPKEKFKFSAQTGGQGWWEILNPRTGKISVRAGAPGYLNADAGADFSVSGGMVLGGESLFDAVFWEDFSGHWYILAGKTAYGAAETAEQLGIYHRTGAQTGIFQPEVHQVAAFHYEPSLGPAVPPYSFVPPRSGSGASGATRLTASVGSIGDTDHAWDHIVGRSIITTGTNAFGLPAGFIDLNGSQTTKPMGEWEVMAHNASHFTSGSTWTVEPTDFTLITFTLIRNAAFINAYIQGTDVGVAAGPILRMATPTPTGASGPLVTPVYHRGLMLYNDAGTGNEVGFWQWAAGTAYIDFIKISGGNWTATTADNTSIFAQIWAAVD